MNQEIITRNDYMYFQIASKYYLQFRKLLNEMNKFPEGKLNKLGKLSEDIDINSINAKQELINLVESEEHKELFQIIIGIRKFGCIVVTFSAMCLEALINDYMILKSSNILQRIDKLSTPDKWVIIPMLILNKSFPTDGSAYQHLKKLFELRNEMVHPKSKKVDASTFANKFVQKWIIEVNNSYLAIVESTKQLYDLDSTFTHLEEYKWLWTKNFKYENPEFKTIESFYNTFFGDLK